MTPISPREVKRMKLIVNAIRFWVSEISCDGFYRIPSMYEVGYLAGLSGVSKAERDYAMTNYFKEGLNGY